MKKRTKPPCADFIVATIRAIRQQQAKMKPGTAAGVSLQTLFSIATETYTEQDFRTALKTLMDRGTVLVIARVSSVDQGGQETRLGLQKVWALHENLEVSTFSKYHAWEIDSDGNFVSYDDRKKKAHTSFFRPLVYVVADGLPKRIATVVAQNRRRKSALEIIRSMQKK